MDICTKIPGGDEPIKFLKVKTIVLYVINVNVKIWEC